MVVLLVELLLAVGIVTLVAVGAALLFLPISAHHSFILMRIRCRNLSLLSVIVLVRFTVRSPLGLLLLPGEVRLRGLLAQLSGFHMLVIAMRVTLHFQVVLMTTAIAWCVARLVISVRKSVAELPIRASTALKGLRLGVHGAAEAIDHLITADLLVLRGLMSKVGIHDFLVILHLALQSVCAWRRRHDASREVMRAI